MENQLPKGWVETTLGEILVLKNGYAFKSKDYQDEGVPIIRISDIGKNGLVETKKSVKIQNKNIPSNFIIEKGDVLIAMSGATTGKYGIFNENINAFQNQRVGNLKPLSPKLTSKKFIFYLLGSIRKKIEEKAYGGAQPNISAKLIHSTKTGFPPLAEQERIVAKLDTLFGHLEKLQDRLSKIPTLLKNFRQSILNQAVTGKLTEGWRGVCKIENWSKQKLGDFADYRLGKMLDKSKNKGNYISYLRNTNIRWFEIKFDDLKQMKVEHSELSKFELKFGDVLVCEGGEPGRAAIWKEKKENIIFQKALHRVRLNSTIIPEFFIYNLRVDTVNQVLEKLFTGTTIKHLTGRSFSKYEILVPPLPEQTEIVRRVESLFAKADVIEAKYLALKAKIDQLPQAILAKAFKGELVPQLPTDGDARELLEEIRKLNNW